MEVNNTTTNVKDNASKLPVKAPIFDIEKARKYYALSVKKANELEAEVDKYKGLQIIPSFGGEDFTTILAFIQAYTYTVTPAKYETSEHYVQYSKGGTIVHVPNGTFENGKFKGKERFTTKREGGELAFKKVRTLLEKAETKEAKQLLQVSFNASKIDSLSKTLGEGLQVAESKLLSAMKADIKVLKNNKPLVIGLQLADKTMLTSLIEGNEVDSKYLNPDTYHTTDKDGKRILKNEGEIKAIWDTFCKTVYNAFKRALSVSNETLTINETYKKYMELLGNK